MNEKTDESLKYALPFGKYKGESLGDILDREPTYVTEFLRGVNNLREPLKKHLERVLAHVDGDDHEEDDTDGTALDR